MSLELLTVEEVASIFRLEPAEVLSLIDAGTLRGFKFGNLLRVSKEDLYQCLDACATNGNNGSRHPTKPRQEHDGGRERLCRTFGGRKTFRVSGHVETGADIWPGEMRYPISFSKSKFNELLAHGRSCGEMRLGASFGGPESGSLGEWIQANLPTKLNPASYVGGLLIEEGYAERARAGVIRFFSHRRV